MRFLRQFFQHGALVLILLTAALLTGCGAGGDGVANGNAVTDNTANAGIKTTRANASREELGMHANFEWETEDLAWRFSEDKATITAAFLLSPEDAAKLDEKLKAKSSSAPRTLSVDDWFPAELVAQGQSNGGSTVPGTMYPADNFYQAPYEVGTITRVNDTAYFVLELTKK